jgi:hypothetical protein
MIEIEVGVGGRWATADGEWTMVKVFVRGCEHVGILEMIHGLGGLGTERICEGSGG